ncbi:hypothetical protein H0H92_000176 [Tricholoma furcatifolium]|nr:hypothetical protein H0H92_000176 [Tricholoma furcatifolium]
MDDIPYTTPDEDPFNVRPLQQQPRRRRSSLLDKWIQEQQKPPDSENHTDASELHQTLANPSEDDLDNYDIVDDDDIPATPNGKEAPATPTASSRRTSKILHTPASFRSFKPFRSVSPATPPPTDISGSPRISRFPFLPRHPRHSTDASVIKARSSNHHHNRSISLSTLGLPPSPHSPCLSDTPNTAPLPKSRPTILGHFPSASTSQASMPSDTAYTPSRPSISSGETCASGTATTESELPMTPSRMTFMGSLRLRSKSNGSVFASASSIFSSNSQQSQKATSAQSHISVSDDTTDHRGQNTTNFTTRSRSTRIPLAQRPASRLANSNVGHDHDDDDDEKTYHATKPPVKQADPTRPHVAYSSGGTLPRVSLASLSSRHRKKKRLVVRGVGPTDVRKFEGVKAWCESFGEVTQIIRMPNGDLHVHFRLVEVADTVQH